MTELTFGFTLSSFIAGVITFLAPCTLPLVPAYLGFISGVSDKELADQDTRARARKKIIKNGISFILGFTIVFVLFGFLAGFLGSQLAPFRLWLTRIGGVFVILFGLFMLGIFKLPFLNIEKRLDAVPFLTIGKPSRSFVIGGALAFGCTPCVGPILASILFLAGSSGTALSGALLLLVFSLGLSLPFILVAIAFSRATKYIQNITSKLRIVSIIGGIFLLGLGILLLTNNFSLLIQYGYELFQGINYEGILKFL